MSTFWIVVLVVVTALLIGAVVLFLVLRNRKQTLGRSSDPRAFVEKALREAWNKLSIRVPTRAEREKLNRVLVLGDGGSGKTSLIAAAGARIPLSTSDPTSLLRLDLIGSSLYIEASGRLVRHREEDDDEHDAFLTMLRGLRSGQRVRPLDLIVLAVPYGALLGEETMGPDQKDLAQSVRYRLEQIERELSLLPPVYLVVTSTDVLNGFQPFLQALPESLRHSILGWSSPHGPLATSGTDWTGEALTSVFEDIAEVQDSRFLSDTPQSDPEGYYLFASQIGAIERPLGRFVDEIFLPSQGTESFVLRGIYFTGAMGDMAPPPTIVPGAPHLTLPPERPIAFARELFEKKILPEAGLVRPSARARARRQKQIFALQIAAGCTMVICSLLLWIESARLDRQVVTVTPLIQDISGSLVDAQLDDSGESDGAYTAASRTFFKGTNGIGTNRLRSFLIPLSWFSSLDNRVEEAMALGYQRIVLESYSRQLPQRIVPLASELSGPYFPMSGDVALEKTPELLRLDAWLRELATFETNADRYGRLIDALEPDSAENDDRIQDVSGIAQYLWSYKVEPGRYPAYYRGAIARPTFRTSLNLEPYRVPVRQRAEQLFQAVLNRQLDLYHEEVLREDFIAIKQGLAELEAGGTNLTPEKLWALRDAIGRAESRLGSPVLGWLTGESPPANAALERLFQQVGESKLLGPDEEQKVRNLRATRLLRFKIDLLGAEAPICGSVLAYKDGIAQSQLSPCVLSLKAPIDALRAQPYMTITASGELPDDGDDGRLVWDVELLKEAAGLPKQLETFLQEGGLKGTDPRLIETLKGVAARAVRTNVMGRVAKAAQRGASLADTRSEVANYTQAAAPMRDILSAFGRLHLDGARDRLRNLARGQGGRLLGQAYGELSRAALYAIEGGTFAWWDGDGTPVFRAFGVEDLGQLTEYSATQRARAEAFSKELAEPTLGALESSEIGADERSTPQISSWRRVVRPLRDYENKRAGNTVSGLERLLLNEMPKITLDNCLAELDKSSRRRESDFFADRRAEVVERLRARCLQLSADDIRFRYSSLRRSFNRDLGGRFPFAKLVPGTTVEDAPIDTVRRIVALSSELRSRYRSALLARGDASAREVSRFLDKMEAVRVFLGPFLAEGESSLDGFYETRIDFRVNQAREVGGYEIAEWGLKVADERLTLGGPKSTVRWRLEDPVKLQLRWAKNSPSIPIPKQDEAEGWAVEGREVATDEQGLWALLRFIVRHQVVLRDEEGGDSGGHTLLFTVRTVPDPEGGFLDRVGDESSTTRVFIRVFLVGTEKDKLLKYPEFPLLAPALTRSAEEGDKG